MGGWGRYAGSVRLTAPAHIREPRDLAFLGRAARARKRLEIDLGGVEWVSPAGVVALLAACLGASARPALEATVHLPESREARTYLAQIGFLAELERKGWAGDSDPDLDPDAVIGPHLPIMPVTTEREVDDASDRLLGALREARLVGGLSDDLIDVLAELAGNAHEHGSECYAVAQIYTGGRSGTPGVYLAVADFGAGFARTLRRRYGPMTDSEAIVRAFEEQVSGTGHPYRGFGLSQIASFLDKKAGNVLHIVSWSGHVERKAGRFRTTERESPLFRGTLASAYIPVPPAILRP